VIHDGDVLESRVVGGPGHRGQLRAEPFRAARRAEVRNLQADLHSVTSRVQPLTAARLTSGKLAWQRLAEVANDDYWAKPLVCDS
jgi:hypothetical protein